MEEEQSALEEFKEWARTVWGIEDVKPKEE